MKSLLDYIEEGHPGAEDYAAAGVDPQTPVNLDPIFGNIQALPWFGTPTSPGLNPYAVAANDQTNGFLGTGITVPTTPTGLPVTPISGLPSGPAESPVSPGGNIASRPAAAAQTFTVDPDTVFLLVVLLLLLAYIQQGK